MRELLGRAGNGAVLAAIVVAALLCEIFVLKYK